MEVKVVIGANYGDEGKGRTTNFLADSSSIVVLNNGGPQRGHTVKLNDGTQHVFHHFGSGTLKGAATLITEDFYVNPMLFMREYWELKEKLPIEVPRFPKIYMSLNCTITTPYEMIANQIISTYIGAKNTCGLGIFETAVQKGKLTVRNFISCDSYLGKYEVNEFCGSNLVKILDQKYKQLHIFIHEMMKKRDISCGMDTVKKLVKDYFKGINVNQLNKNFASDFEEMLERVELIDVDCSKIEFVKILAKCGNLIIENGQGLLLDGQLDPINGTPSITGVNGARKLITEIDKSFGADIELIYVTRPYLTRHGDGPMQGKEITDNHVLNEIKREETTNVSNQWQGTMRFSELDCEKLLERINNDSKCLMIPHKTSIALNNVGADFILSPDVIEMVSCDLC